MKNCLVIAGEKSGEDHFMSFAEHLLSSGEISFWGVGGDRMKEVGVELLYHLNDFSSWGISGVIHKIPFYINALKKIEKQCEQRETEFALLIDFQTFNLKLANKLKQKGIKVFYYVAPQAWAWKSYRARVIEKAVDILFTIIPFEKEWFKQRGVRNVTSVDHPLLRQYGKTLDQFTKEVQTPQRLLLLPGSRAFEVKSLLPTFVETAKRLKKNYSLKLSIVWSSSVKKEFLKPFEEFFDHIYDDSELEQALVQNDLALAASGTVTLTCALFQVPTCVAYRTSLLNEFIFYTFVNYEGFISLANICHEEKVFPEFIQDQVSPFTLTRQLEKWLNETDSYQSLVKKLGKTKELVTGECQDVGHFLLEKMREDQSCS